MGGGQGISECLSYSERAPKSFAKAFWAIATSNAGAIKKLQPFAQLLAAASRTWTDDYSNLFQVLR